MTHKNKQRYDLTLPTSNSLEHNRTMIQAFVVCLHLALLILLYGQTYSFDYVHFDDTDYVTANSVVRSGLTLEGVKWAFTSFYMSNWHPLTWLSHMLDVSLFGTDPGWAHLHNMALHGINSLLVYAILLKISRSWWKACVLSLIFLVHPLHVESVAWIAERKDLLCALFFLAALLLYDNYRARPGRLRYAGVLIAFVLALLSKPMAVTFPVVLLILDFFVYRKCFESDTGKDGGIKIDYFRAIFEKSPLIALSVVMSIVTILAQDAGNSMAYLDIHPISSRWTTATSAYVIYLKQFLMPIGLSAYYPLPESTSLIGLIFPSVILLVLIALSIIFAQTFPLIALGLCWYLVTLLPVIGLIQVGSQAHADRYMYLPSIGVLIACVYLLPSIGKKYFQFNRVLSVVFIVYLTAIGYWQISYWKNPYTLFSHALDVGGPNYLAHIHLAKFYLDRRMLEESRQHCSAAMDINPIWPNAYMAMGHVALFEQEPEEAEKLFRVAFSRGHKTPGLFTNIGIALAVQNRYVEAKEAFETALQIEPSLLAAQENLAIVQKKMEQESSR